jgi:repressor LexA
MATKGKLKQFNQLSERQRNILRFMDRYMQRQGYPPTIREIGEATNINSTSVVNYNLNKLVDAGYLERSDRVSRGLRIVADIPGTTRSIRKPSRPMMVPLIGHIVASEPVEVPDEAGHFYDEDDMIDVPPVLLDGTDVADAYALTVRGNSMVDAMIREGDIVIMRPATTADNGDMVAVWLPEKGQTTLKYFFNEGKKIRLQPAHPTMDPIFIDPANCEIRGKVLSVLRRLS